MLSFDWTDTNDTCSPTLLWSQTSIDVRRPQLYACIIACITHSVFWLQLAFCPSVRQKTIQWIYAYLATDILLLFRFFFSFIVHTTSYECEPSQAWYLFICYFDAAVDNYLNMIEVYILLALNICRYAQIAYNKNVYVTHVRLLILTHVAIYLIPVIILIIQLLTGWAQLDQYVGDSCDIGYTSLCSQIINTIITFVLPIILNILVIYASIRHVHLTSQLRRAQHHVSAREKYNRSLVMQFFIFYAVWLSLWSPNIIVYQFTSGTSNTTLVASLLNYIEICLDPIIVGSLDIRFYKAWKKLWVDLRNKSLRRFQTEQRRVGPATIAGTLHPIQQKQAAATTAGTLYTIQQKKTTVL
jgi:hypothetical protein